MKKTIEIMPDLEGRKIVIINDIRFKGKRNVNWEGVEKYLKEYVGRCYEIVDTSDKVFIGADFPSELKDHLTQNVYLVQMQKRKQMQHKEFQYCCNVQLINVGRKMLKKNIIKMQSLGGIDLQQDLRYRYIIMIQRKWKDLMYIE